MPEPKTTFGPAASRSSRTPILWNQFSDPRQSGETRPPSILDLFSNPSFLLHTPSQVLQVDPSQGDVNTTIRHESIHALLDSLGQAGRQAAGDQPSFSSIAQSLMQARRGGQMSQEAPAYTLSNDSQVSFDPMAHLAFKQGFISKINELDPKVAKALQGIDQRSSGR